MNKVASIRRDGQATPIEDYGTVQMTAAQWAEVIDNPRQRDTDARARRATHLLTPHPTHSKVNMAVLPDGTRIKLDGHTRCLLWSTGVVAPPAILDVQVWLCLSVEVAKTLYETFDSRAAVDNTADAMFGAAREFGLDHKSELLKSLKYANALRVAYTELFGPAAGAAQSVFGLLRYWRIELDLLDQCQPGRHRFPTAITAAAMITFRRYGPGAVDFWTAYATNAGSKLGDSMDGVQALAEKMVLIGKSGRTAGHANTHRIMACVISAFDRYRQELLYDTGRTGGVKPLQETAFKGWMMAAKNAPRGT